MYELDRKFFHKDGSFNVEAAMAAGHKARARELSEGCGIVRDAAAQLILSLWRGAVSCCARIASHRVFQDRTA